MRQTILLMLLLLKSLFGKKYDLVDRTIASALVLQHTAYKASQRDTHLPEWVNLIAELPYNTALPAVWESFCLETKLGRFIQKVTII